MSGTPGRLLALLNEDVNQIERFLNTGANDLMFDPGGALFSSDPWGSGAETPTGGFYRLFPDDRLERLELADAGEDLGAARTRRKARQLGLDRRIRLVRGDAARIPIADQSCDAATIGFGIRNVAEPHLALAELARVLRPGGQIAFTYHQLAPARPPVVQTPAALHLRHTAATCSRLSPQRRHRRRADRRIERRAGERRRAGADGGDGDRGDVESAPGGCRRAVEGVVATLRDLTLPFGGQRT